MNERQQDILSAVVELYTKSALPVGSEALLQHSRLSVSSATVRNDMATLEEEGFLYQPHVSSGRIPTDRGYRFYIEHGMKEEFLSKAEEAHLKKELLVLEARHARLARTTAKLLSALSGSLAVSGVVNRDEFYDFGMKELMEEPEFQQLDEVCRLVEALDSIDEKLDTILSRMRDGETKIFIGSENPIAEISNCSMVVSPYRNAEGDRGVLAIIGPKRMRYAKNKSLLEYMKRILGGGGAAIVIFVAL
jgi:transcriptional regulator of heat shock response